MTSGAKKQTADAVPAPGTDQSFRHVVDTWQHWWRRSVVSTVDQAGVIAGRREECELSARYLLMLAMSAGIAILGLLLSSPAVVIGAMLLSPLMGPIIGLGFALAIGDFQWIKQSSKALGVGTGISILFCALIVLLSPLQTVTPEIAARTQPNLFDLFVALFSAIAGAYAMIRGRAGTVVGVAIATALMPPLAVVGFGLATLNGTVFWGALLLFFTNLMTIAGTAFVMARLYGFSTRLSEKQTNLQTMLIFTVFIALAIPLGLSLIDLAKDAANTRQINGAVLSPFSNKALISKLEVDLHGEMPKVAAVVLTPEVRSEALAEVQARVDRIVGTKVDLSLTQVPVGNSAQAAEMAQLARANERQAAELAHARQLADRLALVAGVSNDQVVVDRERKVATVTARALEGASLGAYRELENRVATDEPGWKIRLRPPARPLPDITYEDDKLTEAGAQALALVGWAGQRVGAPIVLGGPEDKVDLVAATLEKQGVAARRQPRGQTGPVTASWAAPDQ
ncbi:DUF389 domain-containing protein [Altererythrobacter salegens]|uniref:DUF389 domain-containing protein n=2 Tax=Croceibacterium salegens TaxID=1737568 RepID=A0A6I4SSS3_9SPHN|nr:DUF389 domain-containing protein [Croceibacterium salegens]